MNDTNPDPTAPKLELYQEYPPADEAENIARILTMDMAFLKKEYPTPGRALRAAHPKAHGLTRAEFTVHPDLPEDLRVGLFAEPRTYEAWVRFSNASAVRPDIGPDARGAAIKVMGVPGKKLLEDEQDAPTQDFLLLSGLPFFLSGTAADFVRFLTDKVKFTIESGALKLPGLDEVSLLDIRYYSTTPYRFGTRAVQYQLVPVAPRQRSRPENADFSFLRQRLVSDLLTDDVTFDLMVQFQVDPVAQPIENARVAWSEALSPLVRVATLRIPKQLFATPEQDEYGDRLSFNPWHSLPAHQPLGGVNRARKAAYQLLSRTRQNANAAPRREPAGFADFDAPSVATEHPLARAELINTIARYAAIADVSDAEAYCDYFVPEGTLIVYTARDQTTPVVHLAGRDELLAGMKAILAARAGKQLKVLLSVPLIDALTPESAQTRTMFAAYWWDGTAAPGKSTEISISAWYHDTWVRTDDGFRLARRIEHPSSVAIEVPDYSDTLAAIVARAKAAG